VLRHSANGYGHGPEEHGNHMETVFVTGRRRYVLLIIPPDSPFRFKQLFCHYSWLVRRCVKLNSQLGSNAFISASKSAGSSAMSM